MPDCLSRISVALRRQTVLRPLLAALLLAGVGLSLAQADTPSELAPLDRAFGVFA